MILLWGIPEDGPLRAVRSHLAHAGSHAVLLDQFEVSQSSCDIVFDSTVRGSIRAGAVQIDLGSVRSVYSRPYEARRVVELLGGDADAMRAAERFDDAVLSWTEMTDARVVNRPSAMTSNASKPLQAAMIEASGFDVPRTLLTTDPDAATAFCADCRGAIYKSAGSVRSRVDHVSVATIARMGDAACPLQLQEYIPGIDYRVHVVGDDHFACSIQSGAADYRYPAESDVLIEPAELPADVASRCHRLADLLGLAFTGIDLRRRDDGRWFAFEANPSPGYTFYEELTGAPITAALCAYLGRQ